MCLAALRPDTSTVNDVRGDVRATGAIIGLGGGGRICVYSSAAAHLLVDVVGYLAADAVDRLSPAVPQRLVDTRSYARRRPPRAPCRRARCRAGRNERGGGERHGDRCARRRVPHRVPGGRGVTAGGRHHVKPQLPPGHDAGQPAYATLGGPALVRVLLGAGARDRRSHGVLRADGRSGVRRPRAAAARRHPARRRRAASRAVDVGVVAGGHGRGAAERDGDRAEGDGFLTVWPCGNDRRTRRP